MISEVALLLVGALIGVLLGSVGGGGSLLAVPALVYLGAQSVRGAQAGSLLVVAAAAAIGLLTYLRRDQVRLRAGTAFGLAASASAFATSLLSRELNPDLLLLLFAPVMVLGAVAMASDRAAAESTFRPWRLEISFESVRKVTAFGFAVGGLTGLFGVGGGFVIVPVLVVGLGFAVTEAVGTSLLVILMSSLVALAERLHGGQLDWAVLLPFCAAAIAGVLAGSWIGAAVSRRALTRWFALLVVAAALYTAAAALVALL